MADGCLKCGHPLPARAALALADRVRALVEQDAATLERLGIADYRAAFKAAGEMPGDAACP